MNRKDYKSLKKWDFKTMSTKKGNIGISLPVLDIEKISESDLLKAKEKEAPVPVIQKRGISWFSNGGYLVINDLSFGRRLIRIGATLVGEERHICRLHI